MITREQQTAAIFLTLVAATVRGLLDERAKLIRAKAGPRDNGYTAAFVEPLDDYLMEAFDTFWLRRKARDARLEALRTAG